MAQTRYQIHKCGYSRKPWRIIDTSQEPQYLARGSHELGMEVWTMETIQTESGAITVPGPVAFDCKRDAVAALAVALAPA